MPYIKTSSPLLAGVVALLAVLLPATPAHGGTMRTVNACNYTGFGWGDIPITIDSAPVLNGDNVILTQTKVNAELPQWLANYVSLFGPGRQELSVTAWVALAGTGTAEGVQVKRIEGTAVTTITGTTGTPIEVTLPLLDDTAWTPTSGALSFQQAGPKGLPDRLPAGPNGSSVSTEGSVFIRAVKRNQGSEVGFNIDCQPGTTPNGSGAGGLSTTFIPSAASPFATFALPTAPGQPVQPGTGAGSTPTPTVRPIAIRTTKLAFGSKSVKVAVTCPTGGPVCRGSASVRTRGKVKLGTRRKVLTVASGGYTVPAGARRTVTLKLTKDGRSLRKRKKRIGVQIALRPNTGGKATTKKVTLRRR